MQNSKMDNDPDPQHRYIEQYEGQGFGSATQINIKSMMDKDSDPQHRYPEQ
jgi:hypothetical protein